MDDNVFLRIDQSTFKWVSHAEIDTSQLKFAHKINLTIRNSKYAVYSQPIYVASYHGKNDDAPSKKKAPSTELLKSALQKCIRRRLTPNALAITKKLWELSPFELVRRLMIIMCEDVIITEDYGWLSWLLMAYSKKYSPSDDDLERILSLVHWLCKCRFREVLSGYYVDNKIYDLPNNLVLKAILIRMGYGGMSGDIKMLELFYDIWSARIEDNIPPFTSERVPINTADIMFTKQSIPDEAVDFHCSNVCEYIERQTGRSPAEIRTLIWDHRSSINHRQYIDEAMDDQIMLLPVKNTVAPPEFGEIIGLADKYSKLIIDTTSF